MDFPISNAILTALLEAGLVTSAQAADAVARAENRNPVRLLLDERTVSEADVFRLVATSAGLPYLDPDTIVVDSTAADRLEAQWAHNLQALPYAWDGVSLLVAVSNPSSMTLTDDLRRLAGADISIVLAPPTALSRKIGQTFRLDGALGDLGLALGEENVEQADDGADDDQPIIKYVNLLISQAVADRASDIHLEPTDVDIQVRYRIDGVLATQTPVSKALLPAIVSRIKVMSNLDIAERRLPQDGRCTIAVAGRPVDLRVTTLPSVFGEKVVLRILDNAAAPLELGDVGLSQYHQDVYAKHYKRPHGMLLVTGPTGSGKSTTLYATLNTIRSPKVNVVTVEDPVEYRMPGITQVQINPKAGLTFAAALRSILRADPDVVLVGEIRDAETAKIAIEAALTGHLVLTTLHTNDAPSAVTRLVEMGIEPFLVGSALNLVVAQRLLRRLCDRCAEDYTPEVEELASAGYPHTAGEDLPTLKRAVGCSFCAGTGYRGRTAIHEMLSVTPAVEHMAAEGAHADRIREFAINEQGMQVMRHDGWDKVRAGITTIEEVVRVSA